MNEERVEVVAYAGYREEESPRALMIDGKRVEVRKVLDRWTEEKRRRCFKIKGNDFHCCDEAGTWYCQRS